MITLPINVWHFIEHQWLDTYPITENQLGAHAMGHEIAVFSRHNYPLVDHPMESSSDYSVHIFLGGRPNSKRPVHYTGGMSIIRPRDGKQSSPNSVKSS